MRYIEENPVRAGFAASASAWRWSSYRANALGEDDALRHAAPALLFARALARASARRVRGVVRRRYFRAYPALPDQLSPLEHFGRDVRGVLIRRVADGLGAFGGELRADFRRTQDGDALRVEPVDDAARACPRARADPCTPTASNPGRPDSETVGTSGRALERSRPVTAIALRRPDLTCGTSAKMLPKASCTSPATSAAVSGPVPL